MQCDAQQYMPSIERKKKVRRWYIMGYIKMVYNMLKSCWLKVQQDYIH